MMGSDVLSFFPSPLFSFLSLISNSRFMKSSNNSWITAIYRLLLCLALVGQQVKASVVVLVGIGDGI